MKVLYVIITLFYSIYSYGQFDYYSCDHEGKIFQSDVLSCCRIEKGVYPVFTDIAFTPNGTLYGIDTALNLIDLNTQSISQIIVPTDENGLNIYGVGLVAIDDELLIMDKWDSLFIINIATGLATNIGFTGHNCAGDLTFLNGFLYMTAANGDLLQIKLNEINYMIEDVQNIGITDTQEAIYGLFTATDNTDNSQMKLFGFAGASLIKIDVTNASTEIICQISDYTVFGSSYHNPYLENSFYVNVNVITPNSDGINDFFSIDENSNVESFTVINRWGQVVMNSESIPFYWYGTEQNGENLSEGVYFYTMRIKSCSENESKVINGSITIAR